MTTDAEWAALDDLLRSDGWRVYASAMRARWSAEQYEAEVRNAMAEAGAGTDVTGVIGQINATYKGMRDMLTWPDARMRALKAGPKTKGMVDVFSPWRRGPKRA